MLKRPNVFRIDLNAVASCTRELRMLIGPGRPLIATLKANGYGYGVLPVAFTVLQNGADALSMSNPKDAVCLREAGIAAPILLYAGVLADAESVALHEQYGLIPSLHDEASFAGFARHLKEPLPVAVKVDVGPERLGVPLSQAHAFIRRVHAHPRMRLQAVHAHPNVRHGDGEGVRECMAWQHARFARLQQALAADGIEVPWFAMASSKALKIGGASMAMDAADPGQALFSSLSGGSAQAFSQLRTCLLAVRAVERTEHLDQAPFPMRPGMRIGVLPIGYADGMHRVHAGSVLVRGQRVPLVGRPALEYTRIDLDRVPDAQVGDEVVVIGRQGGAAILPDEACAFQQAARVIDLALEIGPAVQREYVHL